MTSSPATALASTIDTPCGPFTIVAHDEDVGPVVLASGWTPDAESLLALVHPGIRPADLQTVPVDRLGAAGGAAAAYFAGDLDAVAAVAVRQRSGPFLQNAWDVLRKIGPGDQVTYAEFAGLCGNPAAVRAAAGACARNAAALFVPCHRVLRTGGALGGFRWGLPVKRWLLDHERAG